jgi:hypothetical protein
MAQRSASYDQIARPVESDGRRRYNRGADSGTRSALVHELYTEESASVCSGFDHMSGSDRSIMGACAPSDTLQDVLPQRRSKSEVAEEKKKPGQVSRSGFLIWNRLPMVFVIHREFPPTTRQRQSHSIRWNQSRSCSDAFPTCHATDVQYRGEVRRSMPSQGFRPACRTRPQCGRQCNGPPRDAGTPAHSKMKVQCAGASRLRRIARGVLPAPRYREAQLNPQARWKAPAIRILLGGRFSRIGLHRWSAFARQAIAS